MDADDSDNDVPSYTENDEAENSSEEDSEEESDDDDEEEEDEGGTDAVSEEEEEEDGEETVSDEDDNGGEAASTATGGDVGAVDSDAEETSDKDLPDLADPDMSCPICLNEFAGQDLGSPENCSHTFCFECIQEWSRNINTCPIDRIEFHLIYVKQEINGSVVKKVKVKVKKEVEEYVEEVTLCEVCRLGDREDRLLLCDSCDSGYHCECLDPPLETIPIDEWFCPPCSRVLNRRANNAQASHSRLIARTSASEIVRSRIQQHRTAYSGDSGSETTQQPHRVRSPARAPRRKKMTKRKTKRKTTRKSKTKQARTKATAAGKSKVKRDSSTAPTKKRKTKRRKTAKKKKKSKKSWLASMKLVAPSVKKRIADHLGLCKPPPGQSMPYVKKSGGQHSAYVEKLPSLDILGCRDKLFDFNESFSDDDDLDNPKPSTSKQKSQAIASRSPIVVASTSGINLLDNILEKQNDLLRNSKNITIGKDGSLNVNEKNSSTKQKCGIKNESKNDTSQNKTSASSSPVCTEKEKDVLAADTPSANTKRTISEDMPSSVSTLSGSVKTERPHLHSRVRFNDADTVFRIENDDACEQTGKRLLPKHGERKHSLLYSSLCMQGKDVPHEKASVSIKKEKDDDLLLNSSVSAKRINTSFDNSSHNSPLSFLNKQDFDNVIDNSGTSTNRPSLSCNTDSYNSVKNVSSSGNPELVQMKMGDTSSSLFDKAENDRKRHLPFLSNSLQRPFKIPKLAKKADKSLVLETKLPSSERVNNHSDTKVLIKSENVSGKLVPDGLQSVNKTECDFKLKNGDHKHTSVDHTDLSEEMDVEVHADQCSTPDAATKSLLQEFKREKVSGLDNKKRDRNSKSSLHKKPKLSGPDSGQLSGSRHSSKGTGNSVQKAASHTSPTGINSHFAKLDRKTHATSSSSKGLKSNEHKHLLNVSSSELQTTKPSEKSSAVKNTELKAPGKLCTGKVPSQQKLKEDIAAEIKKHLKDFYVTDLISKDEYKEIMRRSVPKVLQNCGNSIDSAKIRKLVISYVHMISGTKPDSS